MKKNKNKITNKVLLKIWADRVKQDANYKCEHCGSTKHLNSHHLISASRLATRYINVNGICLCSKCHRLDSLFSAHKGSLAFYKWFNKKYPGRIEYLLSFYE